MLTYTCSYKFLENASESVQPEKILVIFHCLILLFFSYAISGFYGNECYVILSAYFVGYWSQCSYHGTHRFLGFLVEAVSLVLNICFYWDNIMLTLVNARNFRKLTISSLHFPWPACIMILISGSSIIISRINKWSLYPLWATFSALETVSRRTYVFQFPY